MASVVATTAVGDAANAVNAPGQGQELLSDVARALPSYHNDVSSPASMDRTWSANSVDAENQGGSGGDFPITASGATPPGDSASSGLSDDVTRRPTSSTVGMDADQSPASNLASIDRTGSTFWVNTDSRGEPAGGGSVLASSLVPPRDEESGSFSGDGTRRAASSMVDTDVAQSLENSPLSIDRTGLVLSVNTAKRGESAGGSPVPVSSPTPPNDEDSGSFSVDRTGCLARSAGGTHGASWCKSLIKTELRPTKWAMFVVGNLISSAAIIGQMFRLKVCFDTYEGSIDGNITSAELEEKIDDRANGVYAVLLLTLIIGVFIDVFSAFALSIIYRSPLDIKSVHKIPANDIRHCGGSVMVRFIAPLSWSIVYICGGSASVTYGFYSSCGGQGGSGLQSYLIISGLFMMLFGFITLALSVFILPFSCGSPVRRTDQCCTSIRRRVHKYVLSKGPYLNILWKLQGSIWSYRTGSLPLLVALLVGMTGIFGEILSTCGSVSPDFVQALVRPLR